MIGKLVTIGFGIGSAASVFLEQIRPGSSADITHNMLQKALKSADDIDAIMEKEKITCFKGKEICCTREPNDQEYKRDYMAMAHTPIRFPDKDGNGAYCHPDELDVPISEINNSNIQKSNKKDEISSIAKDEL